MVDKKNKKWLNGWVVKWLVVAAVVVVVGGGWLVMGKKEQVPVATGTVPIEDVSESPVPTSGSEGSGQVKEFTVEGSKFKFVPAVMNVKKGDTVRVVFKNIEGLHDFVIDEFDVKTNQINGGDEEEVEFVADKAGTFEYYCSVGTHRQLGMVGKLVVE